MNRVHTYPIIKEEKEMELSIIQDALHNNEYNENVSTRHQNECKNNKRQIDNTRKPNGPFSHIVEKKVRKLQNPFKKHK
jgi:hypothetical protein